MEHSNIAAEAATESRAAFSCDPAAIGEAATYLARRIVERRNTVPILSFVHVVVDVAGTVTLTGTDLDIWASVTVRAAVESPGHFCTDAQALADVMAKARKDKACREVVIAEEFGEQWNGAAISRVTVKAGRGRYKLQHLPVDDFPHPFGEETLSAFTMSGAQLVQDLAALAPCMSSEETKYYLRGVALQAREMAGQQRLVMVATDGKAIGAASRPIPAGAETMADCILPAKAVTSLIAGAKLSGGAEVAAIEIGARYASVTMGPISLTSKLVDGTFPQWELIFVGSDEESQPALFPELLPGAPLPTMEKLAKAVDGVIAWEGSGFGLVGAVDNDPDVIFGTWRDPAGGCAKRNFHYTGNDAGATGEVFGPDGVTYPVAFSKDAINLSAAQLRALIGESCFETMEIPGDPGCYILRWLWEEGDSRFLVVGRDGRIKGEHRNYVTRAEIEAAMASEPEVIEGLGQFKAGRGAIVTDWHDAKAGAIAEYHSLAREAVEMPVPDSLAGAGSVSEGAPCIAAVSRIDAEAAPTGSQPAGDESEPQTDLVAALLERMADMQARLDALSVEAGTSDFSASNEGAKREVSLTVTVTIDMPPIPAQPDNVIPLPVGDRRATGIARAKLELEAARPKRSPAHERAIRQAWKARRLLRWALKCRDSYQEKWVASMIAQETAEKERDAIAEKRRRAVVNARRALSRSRQATTFQHQRADVLHAQLVKLKADMADPHQPERASDIVQLRRERDEARTALAASNARCQRQTASIEAVAGEFEKLVSRVAIAEAAARARAA